MLGYSSLRDLYCIFVLYLETVLIKNINSNLNLTLKQYDKSL